MRLDHRERASEQEVMIVAMALANHSGEKKRKTTHAVTQSYTVPILILPLQEQTCLQRRWWKKGKSHSVSVLATTAING